MHVHIYTGVTGGRETGEDNPTWLSVKHNQKGGKATKAGSKKWAGYNRESSKLKQDIKKRM